MKKYCTDNHTKTLLAARNALFLLFALPGVAFATWISRTAATRDILAVSNAEMGWILFGLSVGSIIGLLSASHFIDYKGARDVIIGSMFLMIVGLLCLGITIYFVSSMGAFSSLLVFGVGYGLAEVALNVEGSAIEQKLGTTLLPKFHGFFSVGTLVGALSGSVAAVSIIGFTAFLVGPPFLGILGEAFGIRNALLAVLLFVLLSGIVSSVTRENTSS
ncbi:MULTISPECIES: MFS transporter [Bacillus]|uniref:MFS transporter n=1 Tax=Bacillus cereus TaxID=1396 RepID=A0A2C1KW44_BACCE|nr:MULTISPECIES: MFS transporter [Bacillus]PFA65594.1 MFS transporter [Bacillus sp. AFS015896]PGL79971.1 MFS transporter [Bacillus sp. AFS054943]PGT96815.1 MFS transporter [Bacillus cereus]